MWPFIHTIPNWEMATSNNANNTKSKKAAPRSWVSHAIVFVLTVTAMTVHFLYELKDPEYVSVSEWVDKIDMESMHKPADTPTMSYAVSTQAYNFGRYRRPIADMNLHQLTRAQSIGQKKEFVWTAVSDNDWFIGCALLQFSYTSGAIVYAYNTKLNEVITTHIETPIVSFLGAKFTSGASTTQSSAISGCATWNFFGLNGSKCYNDKNSRFEVALIGKSKKSGKEYKINYSLSMTDDAMGLVFPIGPNRASVVTKMGGTEAAASIEYMNVDTNGVAKPVRYQLREPLGLMDYTRGLLRRVTLWHWTAIAWKDASNDTHGHRYGLQLSEGTYDNAKNVSLESTLWVDGVARHINSRIIYTQLDKSLPPHQSHWSVRSEDGKIKLSFIPLDVVIGDFHYGILDGNLYHIVGKYAGTVEYVNDAGNVVVTALDGVYGTLEDHYAKW
jgi:hypothetical protein